MARMWASFEWTSTLPPSSVIPNPEYTIGPNRSIAALSTSTGMAAAP